MGKFNRPKQQRNRKKFRRDSEEVPVDLRILDGLTDKQRAFVNEYIKDYNGLQAALRAGFSDRSAWSRAYEMLRLVKVQEAIADREKNLATRFIWDKEKILKELSLLAFSDISDYLTPDGDIKVKNIKELPPQISRAVRKLKIKSQVVSGKIISRDVEFELYDKKAALELMGKEILMFIDRKELTGRDGETLFPSSTQVVLDFGTDKQEE